MNEREERSFGARASDGGREAVVEEGEMGKPEAMRLLPPVPPGVEGSRFGVPIISVPPAAICVAQSEVSYE